MGTGIPGSGRQRRTAGRLKLSAAFRETPCGHPVAYLLSMFHPTWSRAGALTGYGRCARAPRIDPVPGPQVQLKRSSFLATNRLHYQIAVENEIAPPVLPWLTEWLTNGGERVGDG